ncbi:TDT family transporter [Nocardia cyriacigeorgica]|uniref:TDT family transporter n=1 Tax=Nocardia cyriacigeorgica TaxID=135487 RepID=UPI001894FAB4|nr:TDT family transporter [Nocardia cyriacigeorgica]MBF6456181.1 TDT family transporter [Nocardia cyriacigeorgica]MBF6478599.1 TDT family transporter [Nocardia cyriacigeorgica]MBF6553079.1 TDT family transporter [Nocardia cyriacigeorgica]
MTLTATHRPVTVTRRTVSARTGALAQVGLNWFAIVMGTGILANAAATLPLQLPGQRAAATGVWVLATLLLAALGLVWAVRMIRHRGHVRAERDHPVLAHFSGAPPMALLTVGAGAMLLGKDVIGESAAVAMDWVLWPLGTALGLATAVAVPYRMITRTPAGAPDAAFGGWLMPVVPPMVSAATGVLLLPHTPPGQARVTLLACCGAMFGLSLIAALITTTMIWSKLMHFGAPAAALVPTLWIVLGPLGQSVTAAGAMADAAPAVATPAQAAGVALAATVFGIATWGFAMLWLTLALAVTVRTFRAGGLGFSLTWWGFTFPLGTCVTGSTALFAHTGAELFAVAAVALYALLAVAWCTVASRTALGVRDGSLLRPAAPAPV